VHSLTTTVRVLVGFGDGVGLAWVNWAVGASVAVAGAHAGEADSALDAALRIFPALSHARFVISKAVPSGDKQTAPMGIIDPVSLYRLPLRSSVERTLTGQKTRNSRLSYEISPRIGDRLSISHTTLLTSCHDEDFDVTCFGLCSYCITNRGRIQYLIPQQNLYSSTS
jgi:hypothetical protein